MTHDFNLVLPDVKISGECEFIDGQMPKIKITQSSDTIPAESLDWLYRFLEFANEAYDPIYGTKGIIKLNIKKKSEV